MSVRFYLQAGAELDLSKRLILLPDFKFEVKRDYIDDDNNIIALLDQSFIDSLSEAVGVSWGIGWWGDTEFGSSETVKLKVKGGLQLAGVNEDMVVQHLVEGQASLSGGLLQMVAGYNLGNTNNLLEFNSIGYKFEAGYDQEEVLVYEEGYTQQYKDDPDGFVASLEDVYWERYTEFAKMGVDPILTTPYLKVIDGKVYRSLSAPGELRAENEIFLNYSSKNYDSFTIGLRLKTDGSLIPGGGDGSGKLRITFDILKAMLPKEQYDALGGYDKAKLVFELDLDSLHEDVPDLLVQLSSIMGLPSFDSGHPLLLELQTMLLPALEFVEERGVNIDWGSMSELMEMYAGANHSTEVLPQGIMGGITDLKSLMASLTLAWILSNGSKSLEQLFDEANAGELFNLSKLDESGNDLVISDDEGNILDLYVGDIEGQPRVLHQLSSPDGIVIDESPEPLDPIFQEESAAAALERPVGWLFSENTDVVFNSGYNPYQDLAENGFAEYYYYRKNSEGILTLYKQVVTETVSPEGIPNLIITLTEIGSARDSNSSATSIETTYTPSGASITNISTGGVSVSHSELAAHNSYLYGGIPGFINYTAEQYQLINDFLSTGEFREGMLLPSILPETDEYLFDSENTTLYRVYVDPFAVPGEEDPIRQMQSVHLDGTVNVQTLLSGSWIDGPKLSVTFDANENRIADSYEFEIGGVKLDSGRIGSILGSQLATHLFKDQNLFQQTVGGVLVEALAINISEFAHEGVIDESQIADAQRGAFGDIWVDIKELGVGAVSSLLMAEFSEALGLEGFAASLTEAVGGAYVAEGIDFVIDYLSGIPVDDISFEVDLSATFWNFIAAYVGREIASEVYEIETREGAIGSAVGSALGTYVGVAIATELAGAGAKAGAVWGPVGAAIGAAVGYLVGAFLGDKIGDPPRSGGNITFDFTHQTLEVSNIWQKDGGSEESARQILDSIMTTVNTFVDIIGGDIEYSVEQSSQPIQIYFEINSHGFDIGVPGTRTNRRFDSEDSSAMFGFGVVEYLRSLDIAGGDVIAKRALYNGIDEIYRVSAEKRESEGLPPILAGLLTGLTQEEYENVISVMQGNMEIAQQYSYYLANAEYINALIAEDPTTPFSVTWQAILSTAHDLGLHRRHESDGYGGWDYVVNDYSTDATIGSHSSFDKSNNYSTAQFLFVNNERQVGIVDQDGSLRIERDNINYSLKTEISFTDQTSLDSELADVFNAAVINGSDEADVISGGDLGNDIFGGSGNDTITGGANADWIFGEDGDDTLLAGGGDNNLVAGQLGNDTLVGAGGSDWLVGGEGQDYLTGGFGDDVLDGGTGNDSLHGGMGDDVYIFHSGGGQDVINESDFAYSPGFAGYGGTDTIEFGAGVDLNKINVRIDEADDSLIITLLDNNGVDTTDILTIKNWSQEAQRIEYLRFHDGQTIELANLRNFYTGTSLDDVLIGTFGADFIHGGAGDDVIRALAGNDVAVGGLGNDNVSGDEDDDLVVGGDGNDNLYGNDGDDIVSGDAGDDAIAGGDGDDILAGGKGDDFIVAGAGNDTIIFGRGDGKDTVVDGYLANTIFVGSSTFNPPNGPTESYEPGYAFNSDDPAVENIWDADLNRIADGFIVQPDPINPLTRNFYKITDDGSLGNPDQGYDVLEFKVGIGLEDIRVKIEGDNLLIGIQGENYYSQSFDEIEDVITLENWFAGANDTFEYIRLYGENDVSLYGIEGWIDGDAEDGVHIGGSSIDWITSGAGNDVIRSLGGSDIINAGAGDDFIEAGSGSNIVLGGEGLDTISYATSEYFLTVKLAENNASYEYMDPFIPDLQLTSSDRLESIENVIGSDHNDFIYGDDLNNELTGGKGSDYVVGGLGNDSYIYNLGDGNLTISESDIDNNISAGGIDILRFGPGINAGDLEFVRERDGLDLLIRIIPTGDEIRILNQLNYAREYIDRIEVIHFADGGSIDISEQIFSPTPTSVNDWINGGAGNDQLNGHSGNDILSGRDGNDVLNGGTGDDTFFGGLGADVFDGGEGNDTAAYFDSDASITVSLENSQLNNGGTAVGDRYNSIENIVGSKFNDTITGDIFDNKLAGIEGDDVIHGGSGVDIIVGGEGDDTLYGDSGQDSISGGIGNDAIYGGVGYDLLAGGDGNDVIEGNQGDDKLYGGAGLNTLYGGAGNDLILGGHEADVIGGEGGADEVRAGDGDDVIEGNDGADTLFGEAGNDVITGNNDDDFISGGLGNDVIDGGSGRDLLKGNEGDDRIYGADSSDVIDGGAGNDEIYGGHGSDFLIGGSGNDYLDGGEGTDFYVFEGAFGQDVINEDPGRAALDEVVFSKIGINQLWFKEVGDDLVISVIGQDDKVTIKNYARFRINSDLSGALLDQLGEAFQNMAPIDSVRVDTHSLSIAALNSLIDQMALLEEPATLEEVPTEILTQLETLWVPEELTALDARIEYSPSLPSQSFTVLEDTSFEAPLLGSDPNPDELLTYEVVNGPSNGSLVIQDVVLKDSAGNPVLDANGQTQLVPGIVFNPDANFSGVNTAVVRVTDSTGLVDNATLLFRVASTDDAGSITDTLSIQMDEDSAVVKPLGFTDPDNSFSDYSIEHTASQGSLVFHHDGTFTYTPYENFVGVDNFSITLTNNLTGAQLTSNVDVTVNSKNDRPTTTRPVINLNLNEDSQATDVLSIFDADSTDTITYELIGNPVGTVTLGANGQLSYTAAPNFHGNEQFTVRARDNSGDPLSYVDVLVNANVASVNDAPQLPSLMQLNLLEDGVLTGTLPLVDPDIVYGDTHTVSVTPVDAGAQKGSLALITQADGSINYNYTPYANENGVDRFTVTVTDASGAATTTTMEFTINPVNDGHQTVNELTLTMDEDQSIAGDLQLVDPDAGTAVQTYNFNATPNHGSVAFNADGTFVYTPDANYHGTDAFYVSVTDTENRETQTLVTVNVNSIPDSPQTVDNLSFNGANSVIDGGQLVGDLQLVDPDLVINDHTFQASPSLGNIVFNNDGTFTYTANAGAQGVDTFNITVTDSDYGVGSHPTSAAVTSVSVNVVRQEDAPVANIQTVVSSVLENDTSEIQIANVLASDQDGDALTYQLQNTYGGRFQISQAGVITKTGALNYEDFPDHQVALNVVVSDGIHNISLPTLSVAIVDVAEPPTILVTPFNSVNPYHIDENSPVGTVLATINAADEAGNTPGLSLTVRDSSNNVVTNYFSISNNQIVSSRSFDFENNSGPFTIEVTASAAGGSVTSPPVTVSVIDVNDTPLSFTPVSVLSVNEDAVVNGSSAFVGYVDVTDQDANETFTFSILDGPNSDLFDIRETANPNRAAIYLNTNIDYESVYNGTTAVVNLGVVAADRGGLEIASTLNINIGDVNENPELFGWGDGNSTITDVVPTISEDASGGQVVGIITAINDPDVFNDNFRNQVYAIEGIYRLENGSEIPVNENLFAINSSTGVVEVGSIGLDVTQDTIYNLAISVNGVTDTFGVKVTNSNSPPSIAPNISGPIDLKIKEFNAAEEHAEPSTEEEQADPNSDKGGTVNGDLLRDAQGNVINLDDYFTDPDGDALNYQFTANPSNVFSIAERNVGGNLINAIVVNNAVPLDFENTLTTNLNSFSISVEARDGDGAVSVAPLTFNIDVTDIDENEELALFYGAVSSEPGQNYYFQHISGTWNTTRVFSIHRSTDNALVATVTRYRSPDPEGPEVVPIESVAVKLWDLDLQTAILHVSDESSPDDLFSPLWNGGYGGVPYISADGALNLNYSVWIGEPILDEEGNEIPGINPALMFVNWNLDFYYSIPPIAIDLDGDGLEWSASILYDADYDGELESAAWVGADDGLLVLDRNGDGFINSRDEISFVDDLPGARTDLEGLAAFDTNSDGIFDVADAAFDQFQIWQDSNQNGISEANELSSLAEAGIASINLTPTPSISANPAPGVNLINTSTYQRTDGSTSLVGDVRFSYSELNNALPATQPVNSGTAAADTMIGGLGMDNIDGLAGDDIIFAGESNDFAHGGDGNDLLSGEQGDDLLYGDAGDDELQGAQGRDFLFGGVGNDQIFGGEGDDSLYGEDGIDTLYGGLGNDSLFGGAGADILISGDGNNLLSGDAGDDILIGGDGYNTFIGGAGNDRIEGGAGINVVQIAFGDGVDALIDQGGQYLLRILAPVDQVNFKQTGNQLIVELTDALGNPTGDGLVVDNFDAQTLVDTSVEPTLSVFGVEFSDGTQWGREELLTSIYQALNPYIEGTSADDVINGSALSEVIEGYSGNDTISGMDGDDEIYGNDGADILSGGLGEDALYGGVDNDTLIGEDGADILYGQDGTDALDGGAGDDQLFGGNADDNLVGGDGADQLYGQAGNDILDGGNDDDYLDGDIGDDQLTGGAGLDTLYGGAGNDLLAGGADDDYLSGGDDDDTLSGDAGNDFLLGNAGNDVLTGGAGTDLLHGYTGNDIFDGGTEDDVIDTGEGVDTILFSKGDGNDVVLTQNNLVRIVLTGFALNEFSVSVVPSDAGESLILQLGTTDSITLSGVSLSQVLAGEIIEFVEFKDANGDLLLTLSGNEIDQPLVPPNYINGNYNHETLIGTEGVDFIYGATGNDTLIGLGGNDTFLFNGVEGIDVVSGGAGIDTILGSDADDSIGLWEFNGLNTVEVINGGIGHNIVRGGYHGTLFDFSQTTLLNIDEIDAGSGNDTVIGSSGNDVIRGGDHNDTLYGGAGDDVFVVDEMDGMDYFYGDEGFDTILGSVGSDSIGIYHINPENSIELIDGGEGNNKLFGNYFNNLWDFSATQLINIQELDAGNGYDTVIGSSGNDVIRGGSHNDTLYGQEGDDTFLVDGADGMDYVYGGGGNDTLLGGSGNDSIGLYSLFVDNSLEVIDGGLGANTIFGSYYDNYFDFSNTNLLNISEILGGNGQDTIIGSAGSDFINGGASQDLLYGGSGADTLYGDTGSDFLSGGEGNDFLSGDSGNDTYEFSYGFGNDIIQNLDLENGIDVLNITGGITLQDVSLQRDNLDLVIVLNATQESIRILNHYSSTEFEIDSINFDDGTSISASTFAQLQTGPSNIIGINGMSLESSLDQLVMAMNSFGTTSLSAGDFTSEVETDDQVIHWAAPSMQIG